MKKLKKYSRIAAYLRKSRLDSDNSEETLSKHRLQLTEYVNDHQFTNVEWFEEVESADSIIHRPVFQELLKEIAGRKYEAVLVVATDRLCRGSQTDAGRITDDFTASDTLILTPMKTYDLTNESDLQLFEFETLFARTEYRAIKRRLVYGKINGTKKGNFVCSRPVFPYYYDRNDRQCKIDPEKLKVYKYIKSLFLDDNLSTLSIAKRLNRENVPTITNRVYRKTDESGNPRTTVWSATSVKRLLISEFHLGFVVWGRSKRRKDGTRYYNPDYVRAKGNHKPIKTPEEHEEILRRMEAHRIYPKASRSGKYVLSGMIRCAYCGNFMIFCQSKNTKVPKNYLKRCHHMLSDGIHHCSNNHGCAEDIILQALKEDMKRFRVSLFAPSDKAVQEQENDESPIALINIQKKAVEKSENRISRIKDLYIDAEIDRQEFEERKKTEESRIRKATEEINRLSQSTALFRKRMHERRMKKWRDVDIEKIFDESLTTKERNSGLKMLIESIEYKKETTKSPVYLKINYR